MGCATPIEGRGVDHQWVRGVVVWLANLGGEGARLCWCANRSGVRANALLGAIKLMCPLGAVASATAGGASEYVCCTSHVAMPPSPPLRPWSLPFHQQRPDWGDRGPTVRRVRGVPLLCEK